MTIQIEKNDFSIEYCIEDLDFDCSLCNEFFSSKDSLYLSIEYKRQPVCFQCLKEHAPPELLDLIEYFYDTYLTDDNGGCISKKNRIKKIEDVLRSNDSSLREVRSLLEWKEKIKKDASVCF